MVDASKAPSRIDLERGEAFQVIEQAIQRGQFTPFLGAGASSLRPMKLRLDQFPWSEVKENLMRLRERIRNSGEGLSEPYLYLRSFAAQRLRLDDVKQNDLFPLIGPGEPNWEASPAEKEALETESSNNKSLLDFQFALTRCAAELGKHFGIKFAEQYPAIVQISDCRVPVIPAAGDGPSEFFTYVMKLADEAATLSADSAPELRGVYRGHRPVLKTSCIREKIILLVLELANEAVARTPEYQVWSERHRKVLDSFPAELQELKYESSELSLGMLQWLSDLLWYSFRFWIPHYPTTAELAFELSLEAEYGLPRRAALAQVAEALYLDNEALAKRLTDIFGYREKILREPSQFHIGVVAALQHLFDVYTLRRSKIERRSRRRPPAEPPLEPSEIEGSAGERGGEADLGAAQIPIAFTTNFDRALERIFEDFDLPYHVVYPVLPKGGAERAQVKWRIYSGASDRTTEDCPEDVGQLEKMLRGPVVVKLHGSPLDAVDEDRDQHWLVLSESGYLQAMDREISPLPGAIEAQLKGSSLAPRSLWFLGYSVSDWNVRLRLYEHVSHSGESTKSKSERGVVDRGGRLDWFGSAVLGNLDIKIYEGDLLRLPSIIQRALERADDLSSEVEMILRELD